MALQIIFQYQHTDATSALNQRLARLIGPGIYYGGTLSYSAGANSAQRSPVLAIGYDGVTVADTSSSTVAFTAAGTYYVVIRAKYNTGGSPATPTISEETMTAAQYAVDPDLNYLIRVGSVTCAAGGIISSISYAVRDVVDAIGRETVRGVVTAIADLPSPSPTTNRAGDNYFVTAEESWYYWTGSAWAQAHALGATTRQTAYDDTGSGAGRTVNVNSQAILDVQSSATQRQRDIANAARRIDKTGSTIVGGDIGEDIKVDGDRDYASYLARSRYTNGANVQTNEAITLVGGGNTVTLTRPTAMTVADGYHCMLVEISGTTNNQDGLYRYTRSAVAAGTLTNLDGTSPVLAADTGTANFYTIRFLVGSFINTPNLFSLKSGLVTFAGPASTSGHCGHLHLMQDGTGCIRKIVNIDTAAVLGNEFLYDHKTFSQFGGYESLNYMDDDAGFAYQFGHEIEKWIWPNWESARLGNDSAAWRFEGNFYVTTPAEGCIWFSNYSGAVLNIMTSDWPEGMTLTGIEFDWSASTNTSLFAYIARHQWPVTSSTATKQASEMMNLYSSAYYAHPGTGRTRTVVTPTKNYGQGAPSGITTPWTHGGSVTTQTSDKLIIQLRNAILSSVYVYGIRIKVKYRSINKWDGAPYEP